MINKKKDNVVIIFAKKPELGKVKTRIAKETSNTFAFEFTKACIMDLLHKINISDYYDLIVGVDNLEDLQWFQENYSLEGIQVNVKRIKNKRLLLSSKLEIIFSTLLNKYKYKKAILIPMDIPFISEEDLITTFARLDQKSYALGPEVNGGIYLIGLKSFYKEGLFKDVNWSTSHTYEDLILNIGEHDCFSLKLKNDLNKPEDILKLRDTIYSNCPILFSFLERNNYYFSVSDKYVDYDDLSICIPMVSNVVRRINKEGQIDLLIQTRHRPISDPDNLGKIEIPAGPLKKYELAHEAILRQTKEKTGIIAEILHEYQTVNHVKQKNGNIVGMFRPFFCQQQLKGDRAYLSIVFISDYIRGKLKENIIENKNPRWIPLEDLRKIVQDNPEKVFSLSLAALIEFFNYRS